MFGGKCFSLPQMCAMRLLLFCICAGVVSPVFSQSKKELEAQVARLEAQLAALNAEIAELKSPVEVNLADSTEQVSYCFGVVLGHNFKNTGLDTLDLHKEVKHEIKVVVSAE